MRIPSVHYPILTSLGLTENEAVLYQLLLELGPKPANELLKPSGLQRGNLYNTLTRLKEKELVSEQVGKKTIYTATDPERLRVLAATKLLTVQETIAQLDAALPAFKSLHRLITAQPSIRTYEGVEGLKNAYRQLLELRKPITSLVGLQNTSESLNAWIKKVYIPERVARGISVQGVVSDDARGQDLQKQAKEELRHIVLIDPMTYPFSGDVSVCANSVAFMDHKTQMASIIESASLASTLRSAITALMQLQEEKTR